MITMSVDTSSAEAKIQALINEAPALAAQVLFTSGHAVLVPAIRQRIKKNNSVFRGELFQRIAVRTATSIAGKPGIDIGALGVPYGKNVELGAPAHAPDKGKILEYVKKKMGVPEPAALRVASAIVTSIETKGTIAHPYIEPVWSERKDEFFGDFVARMKAKLGT